MHLIWSQLCSKKNDMHLYKMYKHECVSIYFNRIISAMIKLWKDTDKETKWFLQRMPHVLRTDWKGTQGESRETSEGVTSRWERWWRLEQDHSCGDGEKCQIYLSIYLSSFEVESKLFSLKLKVSLFDDRNFKISHTPKHKATP